MTTQIPPVFSQPLESASVRPSNFLDNNKRVATSVFDISKIVLITIGLLSSLELISAAIYLISASISVPVGLIVLGVGLVVLLISLAGIDAYKKEFPSTLKDLTSIPLTSSWLPARYTPSSWQVPLLETEPEGELNKLLAEKYAIFSFCDTEGGIEADKYSEIAHKTRPFTIFLRETPRSIRNRPIEESSATVLVSNSGAPDSVHSKQNQYLSLLPTGFKDKILREMQNRPGLSDDVCAWETPKGTKSSGKYIFFLDLSQKLDPKTTQGDLVSSPEAERIFTDLVQSNSKLIAFAHMRGVSDLHLQELLGINLCPRTHPERADWRNLCFLALLYAVELEQLRNHHVKSISIDAVYDWR
ncbi:hypothetical protein [Chlamydiifrater phoenicopteri]|uniref:hypothetical protein n=1 Tax=Chlamydiifrater phoenicopteri TaxID=2681469 RepID=UPI001BD10757|nr:hypothetical protein [Chlamydiifrater phoenicopteri]